MEVEWHQLPATFTDTANLVSPYVSSGSHAATPALTGLALGNYGWHYRVVDSQGLASSWSSPSSPYDFTVQATGLPTISITSPNSTTTWTAGTSQNITWTVSDPLSQINYYVLDYSLDGVTWTYDFLNAYPPSTSVSWAIPPNIASTHAIVRLKAFNSSAMQVAASVSPAFTISSSAGNPTSVPTCNNRSPSPASAVTITFNGTASTGSSPSCGIASYLWTFGDGSPSGTGPTPSHTYYPSPGSVTTYNVYLQVTDSCGKIAANAQPLTITITGQALGNNNPTQPTSKDPVNLATGNYTYNHVDMQIPGRGVPFKLQRYYNSKDTASTGLPLGFGWTDSYNIQLSVSASNNAVLIAFGDGHQEMYATNGGGGYISQPGIYNVLTASGGTSTLTTKEQQKYNFNSLGQLTSIVDKNNNAVTLAYTGNNLTTITDTVGRAISFAYNANNCLTNITDPLGRTVQFGYDANTNLISVTDTRGGLTQFGYDQYHQLTNAIDPRGNTFVSMVYDDEQRVVSSQKDALQGATTFSYDFVSGITTVVDAMTNVSYYHYDPELRVTEIDDNLGNKQFFQYDTNNNRIQVIDKNGKSTAYAYDGSGNVISKTDPFLNTTTISYDPLNNPTNRLDPQSGLTLFSYDSKGNLTNTFNSLGKTNTYQYDAFGEPVVVTDANGNSTANTYDSFGNLIQTQDALGDTSVFAYDAVGRKTKQVDALGRTTLFIYDNADNLTASVNALGKTNYFSFDGNNNRVTATDFNGNTTTNVYDPKDRLIIVRDPMGGSITNDYDALDRKIHVWDAKGGVTRYGYDADGNLLAVTNAVGAVTRYAYDPNGNRTNVVDALGNSTANVFDSLNRLVSTQDALGHTTASVYDALGRRIQGIDALNRTNFFAYDSMGRLTNFTDAAGGTVRYTYDNVGNRLFSTDPNGHTTTNVFDALNRLSKTTDPVGGVLQLGYDAVGNLVGRKDPNGITTTYLYDANNRRTKITYPTGAPVTFGYDANGNRTSMTDSLGTTTYAYDALNRLTSVTDCYGKAVSYGYDKKGNRTSITYPGNKTVRYAYDASNRLKMLTDWLDNTTTYNYDADGNLTGSVNPNGTAAVYQYDPANRLSALTNTGNSAIISSYQYTLDAVGNHSQVNQTEQLPTIPVVGQFAYAYDNDNKMTSSEGQAQGFDANGNMIFINGTDTLSYDFENRLTYAAFVGDGGATNTYQYDGAGNRMAANRGGVVSRYVLDRNSPLSQVLAETDSSGNIIYYYIYGLGLISRIDINNNAQFYHYDSRGSTVALTAAGGQIMEAYAYDPFGRPINGIPSDNRFRYLGRHGVMDEENGFLYIRARYYSTKRGRFTTKDPTTGKDGDSQSMNRYIYALNNPVRLIDISGLSPLESASQLNQNGTSDQQHQNLIDSHHLTPEQAAIILQSQQAALYYELEAIHYEEEANILQGVYDALQTTEGLLTGNWLSVASGLSHQLSTLADITGHNNTAVVLNVAGTAGDIIGIGQEVQGVVGAAGTLQSSLISNGGDLLKSAADNAKATEDLISPIVSHGIDFIRVAIWGQ
jgi:RHS repeat-associated protein